MNNIIDIHSKSKQNEKDTEEYIIAQTEKLLEIAKSGDIEELAIVYIQKNNSNNPVVNITPAVSLKLLGALDLAKDLMKNGWSLKKG
jgi:hypothetical protein